MGRNNEAKTGVCPVMHGSMTKTGDKGTSNTDWWPNQLNLKILHQHTNKSDPMGNDFNYADEFKKLDYRPLKKTLKP